jgi:hypothetical protein
MSDVASQPAGPPPRPWYRLHALTWAALLVVAAALAARQMTPIERDEGSWTRQVFGWPVPVASRTIEHYDVRSGLRSSGPDRFTVPLAGPWHHSSRNDLYGPISVSLLLLLTTGYAVERWTRRGRPWHQATVTEMVALVTLCGVVLALRPLGRLSYGLDSIDRWRGEVGPLAVLGGIWNDAIIGGLWQMPLYARVPLLFALGCVIFAVADAAVALVAWLTRIVLRAIGRPRAAR